VKHDAASISIGPLKALEQLFFFPIPPSVQLRRIDPLIGLAIKILKLVIYLFLDYVFKSIILVLLNSISIQQRQK
jgi:hypothetical protein